MLLWPLAEVLQHQSDNPLFFQRYSPAYFVWVLFYLVFFAAWTCLTLLAFFRWDWLVSQLQGLRQNRRRSALIWYTLPLPWIALIAFVWSVSRTASGTTPHSAAVPLALLSSATLILMYTLAADAMSPALRLPKTSFASSLNETGLARRLDAIAQWLATGRRRTVAVLGTITAIAVGLLTPALFRPDQLVGGGDLRYLYYILEQYTSDTMRAGKLPVWYPYLFSGYPLLSHPQAMVFYPIQLVLRLLLPVSWAITWGIFFHIWISGAGMYALCRVLKLRPWIALTCAIAFMLNGGLLTRLQAGHVWLVFALAWLPLAWTFVILALRGSLPALAGAGLVLALIILTGHPTLPAYILLFLGLYWVHHVGDRWRTKHRLGDILDAGIRFGLILLIALGLAAIQLLPTATFAAQASLAGGYDLASANVGALAWHHLTMIVLPDAYPLPDQAIWEQFPYLGLLMPVAALWGLAHPTQRRLSLYLGLTALLAVVLAFGHELRLFSLLYYVLPPFRILRVPPRALLMWIPAVIVLGGLGLQALTEHPVKEGWVAWGAHLLRAASQILTGILSGYGLAHIARFEWPAPRGLAEVMIDVMAFGVTWLLVQFSAGLPLYRPGAAWWRPLTMAALAATGVVIGLFLLPRAIPADADAVNVVVGFAAAALLLFLMALLLPAVYRSRGRPGIALLVWLIVLGDLFSFGMRHVPINASQSTIDSLERQALTVIPPPPGGRFMAIDTPRLVNEWAALGISNIDGYNSGFLKGYASYLRGVSTNPPADTVVLLSNTSPPDLDERALDFMGVTHILSGKLIDDTGRELVGEVPGKYFIYRNPDALPVAFWVADGRVIENPEQALRAMLSPGFDYRATVVLEKPVPIAKGSAASSIVEVVAYEPASGGFLIRTLTRTAGVLVLSEPYYSERRAQIDGQEVPLLRANVGFMALALPAGAHEIRISYVPTSVYHGAQISLATALVCLAFVAWPVVQNRLLSGR